MESKEFQGWQFAFLKVNPINRNLWEEEEFKLNGVKHKMKKFTLGLQADIENEDITIRYSDVVEQCTDMNIEDMRNLHEDQLLELFIDIQEFTNDSTQSSDKETGDVEPKKL